MVYISTQSFQSVTRQPMLQTESALATAQQEVASGVYADLGLQLGSQTSNAISLAQQSDQITSLTASNVSTSTRLSATNSALTAIMSDAQSLSDNLIGAESSPTVLQTLSTQAQSSLSDLVGQLNTSSGGQYIFGGTNTQTTPITTSASIQSAATSALTTDMATSQSSGTDLGTVLSGASSSFSTLFQGSGWSSLSSASSTTLTSQISPTQTTTSSVSANQSAFQQIAQAYSLLSAAANQNLTTTQTQDVVAQASSLLNSGISSLTEIQAGVGVTQDAVTSANSSMAAQQTILTKNVASLEDVDATTLSTTVTNLQTQLQDSYSLTSQLKSLSLVNYLTAG
ncbi:MAG: flagellar hook-associated family protein [Beijerinckiaceae bacterium]|nr:flagellar hook-associated family protein [Beijerinckiaceae bacterium]